MMHLLQKKLQMLTIVFLSSMGAMAQAEYITTWNTTNAGVSNSNSIIIPAIGGRYDVDIGNDGSYELLNQTGRITIDVTAHGYAAGVIQIALRNAISGAGNLEQIQFEPSGTNTDNGKIVSIDQWGNSIVWLSMHSAYHSCINLDVVAFDAPNLSQVFNMILMFANCTSMVGTPAFNTWDVSNVTTTGGMFGDTPFNQPLNNWDVSNVTNMGFMFSNCPFNQPIGNWVTSSVTNLTGMFFNNTVFNQPIGNWDVSLVTNMQGVFNGATSFNQPLNNWNVSSVIVMDDMFRRATSFNQPLNNWDVSNVVDMNLMFLSSAFNQPIGNWDVSSVTNMGGMFFNNTVFNQPIGSWDVSSVIDMNSMFNNATTFNQSLGAWNIGNLTSGVGFLDNSGLSLANWDATLTGWDAQGFGNPNVTIGANGLQYCSAQTQRDAMQTAGIFTFVGDVLGCTPIITCGDAFNASSISKFSNRFEVTLHLDAPTGLAFNTDGTKMFAIAEGLGGNDDIIAEYNLSIGFDTTTAVYAGAAEQFFVGGQESDPHGLTFNAEGTKMFVIGLNGDAVVEYNLGVAFDVSTAIHAGAAEEFFVGGQETSPTGLAFNTDGTKMFAVGVDDGAVVEYNLSTGFDVSTAVYAGASEEFFVGGQESSPTGLTFNTDGTKMFVIGLNGDAVVEYNLSAGFDVSTAVYAGTSEEFSLLGYSASPVDLVFNTNGTKLYVLDGLFGGNYVLEFVQDVDNYHEATATNGNIMANTKPLVYTIINDTFSDTNNDDVLDGGFTISNLPSGLTAEFVLSHGDTRATLVLSGNAANNNSSNSIATLNIVFNATAVTSNTAPTLNCSSTTGIDFIDSAIVCANIFDVSTSEFSNQFSVNAQENQLRGVEFNTDGTKMFVIGDSDDAIVEYNLSTGFDVSTAVYAGASQEFFFGGQVPNPLNFAFSTDGTKLFIINGIGPGGSSGLYQYNLGTGFDVSTAVFAGGFHRRFISQESFPTDLAFNTDGSKMFIIGVSDDAVIEYILRANFDISTMVYAGAAEEFSVVAQESEPTGLAFNTDGTKMFVIGNSGDAVVEYNLSTGFDVSTAVYSGASEEFSVTTFEAIPRGLAFNANGSKLYVSGLVRDSIIEFAVGEADNYEEASINNGSIATNTSPFIYNVSNDTFADVNNDDILDGGFTIGNLSPGLTPQFVLSNGDTTATLVLSGNATNNSSSDNIADLNISFNTTAITSTTVPILDCNTIVGIDFLDNINLNGRLRHGKFFLNGSEQPMVTGRNAN
ncbi:BspA family leucine-rich repeat surface protein [Flavivirga rizhaonensis]|nr:BspA family leucine-rich repeat surface protein [Flavivirga rizhaonensis]